MNHSPETIQERQERLQREINERYKLLHAMEADIERDTLKRALTALGQAGAILAVDCCHEECIDGKVLTSDGRPDGYELQKLVPGFHNYHESMSVVLDDLRISLRANDGIMSLGIYYENKTLLEAGAKYDENLKAAKSLIRSYGIQLSDAPLQQKRLQLMKDAEELTDAIKRLNV
jgi:hypothetical protein